MSEVATPHLAPQNLPEPHPMSQVQVKTTGHRGEAGPPRGRDRPTTSPQAANRAGRLLGSVSPRRAFIFNFLFKIYFILYLFGCAVQHVGIWFPDQGSNPHLLHGSTES